MIDNHKRLYRYNLRRLSRSTPNRHNTSKLNEATKMRIPYFSQFMMRQEVISPLQLVANHVSTHVKNVR